MTADNKANQASGVTISGGLHVQTEADRQNAAFFAYRKAQRKLEAERDQKEAALVTEDAAKRATVRAATEQAFYSTNE